MKHRMKWCELREYKWNEYVSITVESLQRDSNPWPLCSPCSALPAELWRPIHWRQANLFFQCMGLHSSADIALQGDWHRGHGFESRWSPEKLFSGFQATSQLLKLRFNCDGHIFISFVFPQFTSFHSVFHSFHGSMNSINWPTSSYGSS